MQWKFRQGQSQAEDQSSTKGFKFNQLTLQ
jgi:hypothetical protein